MSASANDRGSIRGDVDAVGRGQTDRGDEDTAHGRPGDHAEFPAQRIERRGRGQLVAGDEPRHHRVERRPLEAVDRGHERRDDEEHPDLRLVEERVEKEDRRREPERELGELEHAPTIYGIGESAADERREEQGDERSQAEKPDRQRRPGEMVDLVRDRDVREHRAEERERLPGEEQPVLPMAP